jgi:predicted nucleotidyltransferase/uncharacterized protein (UPF0332 family)
MPKKPKEKHEVKENRKIQNTWSLVEGRDIAYDFAVKVYERFNKLVKSIILFGSTSKETASKRSDIDLIIIIDDCTIQWDEELIAWYREELRKLVSANRYRRALHINSVRLSTWWADMIRGDPVVINVIRYGEALVDFGGFFNPLKVLLSQGKIKSTPEAIYAALQRSPAHLARSKAAILNAIEGLYWAMVDSAHAALIAAEQVPPSPEHIAEMLKKQFVDTKLLSAKYVVWYRDLYILAHKILHGTIREISGKEIDTWQARADEFVREMAKIIKKLI